MISEKLLLIVSVVVFGVLASEIPMSAVRRSERSSDPNVPGRRRSRSIDEAQIPDECKRMKICDQSNGYQDDVADFVIPNLINNNTKFNSDVMEPPELESRAGETQELCTSKRQLYHPKLAQDAERKWHRILNTDSNTHQSFRVEMCQEQDGPCSPIAVLQDHYQSACVQKFEMRNMYALDDKDQIIEKAFFVPSCCSCSAKSV